MNFRFTAYTLFSWLLLSSNAHACWNCHGLSEEACQTAIEESRQATLGALKTEYASVCAQKSEPWSEGFGLSTVGNFLVTCNGSGGGCLKRVSDDFGRPSNELYPLGSAYCQAESTAESKPPTRTLPSNYSAADESGNRVVFLSEEAALAHQARSLP